MKSKVIIISLVVGALTLGFVLGQQVQANPFAPGSEEDPLVARSYVEEQLQLNITELEQELVSLKAKAEELQEIVDQLRGQ